MNMKDARSRVWRLCLPVLRVGVVLAAFVVITQDFQVFPLLITRFSGRVVDPPPTDIEALTPISEDGSSVLVWRLRAPGARPRVALLFHGNGESVASFQGVQRWLATQGVTSYSMEFRGYNGSASGWPSERGLYDDARAAFELMLREEGIEAKDAVVLGSSLGTGIASHIAARYEPGTLVLLSPYTSLPEVVASQGLVGYLVPFLWYKFPSLKNIASLRSTCVVAAHGRRDSLIPFEHSERLRAAYSGAGSFTLLESAEAGHNDILGAVQHLIPRAIQECFGRDSKA